MSVASAISELLLRPGLVFLARSVVVVDDGLDTAPTTDLAQLSGR